MLADQNLQEINQSSSNNSNNCIFLLLDYKQTLILEKFYLYSLYLYCISAPFSISISQIALTIAFLSLIINIICLNKIPILSSVEFSCISFIFISFLSTFNALDLCASFWGLRENLLFLVFIITFWGDFTEKNKHNLISILIFSSIICLIVSLIKFSSNLTTNIAFIDTGNIRMKGFFSIPLTFGNFFSILSIFYTSLLVNYNKFLYEHYLPNKFVIIIATILSSTAVILSQTRGAYISLIIGFIILFIQYNKKFLFYLMLVILLIFTFLVNINIISMRISKAHISFEAFFRYRIWNIGYTIFCEFPYIGVSKKSIKPLYRSNMDKYDINHKIFHGHLHQNFLEILVASGLFGLVTFVWFIIEIYKICFNASLNSDLDAWNLGMIKSFIAVFSCFLATGITECSFFDEEVSMLGLFLTGIILNPCRNKFNNKSSNMIIRSL